MPSVRATAIIRARDRALREQAVDALDDLETAVLDAMFAPETPTDVIVRLAAGLRKTGGMR